MITTAVILAGGMGTRLRPLTDITPKPLLPVQGKPTIQHLIENLRNYGVTNIILSVSYKAALIQQHFGNGSSLGVTITYSLETEPLGTGGAVKKAAQGLIEPFFLTWGDGLLTIDFEEVYTHYRQNQSSLLMVLTQREDVENFGVAVLDGNRITGFIDKPPREKALSNIIDIGVYIVNPVILTMLPEGSSSIEKDCFEKLVPQGKVISYIYHGQWFPTDTLEKYKLACEKFKPLPQKKK